MEAVCAGQQLWFTDKNTGEQATVIAEEISNGKITIFYQGKKYAFPETLLGERIFITPPKIGKEAEAKGEAETEEKTEIVEETGAMKAEVFYRGEFFAFHDGQWTSDNGFIPKRGYQKILSDVYQARHKQYTQPVKELIQFAQDQLKDTVGIEAALQAYEIAMIRATVSEARWLLPKLSSLYRQSGLSNAAVSLYDYAVMRYRSKIMSAPFATSIAAAYMDIGDINKAEALKNTALGLSRGADSAELSAFNLRFLAETRLE